MLCVSRTPPRTPLLSFRIGSSGTGQRKTEKSIRRVCVDEKARVARVRKNTEMSIRRVRGVKNMDWRGGPSCREGHRRGVVTKCAQVYCT
jgi:hypothetical protein